MRTWIVIPCYNEAERLRTAAFDAFLGSREDVAFVLVDDGSTDGTPTLLRSIAGRWPDRVAVLEQRPNQGKGEAVRVGMLRAFAADCEYAGYFDADLSTPLEDIADFVTVLDQRPDVHVVLGARVALLGRTISRNPVRHYTGRVFATATSLVLGLPVYDTQGGAKLFRAGARTRALFEKPFGSRWIFDVELLARYLAAGGPVAGLYELALRRWVDVAGSRVRGPDFLRAIGELAVIHRSYRLPTTRWF